MSDANNVTSIETAKAQAIALLKGGGQPVMKEMTPDEFMAYAFDGIEKAVKWESIPLRLKALDGIQKSIDAMNDAISKAQVDDGLGAAKANASSGSGAPGPDNDKAQWTASIPVQVDDDTDPKGKVVDVGLKKNLDGDKPAAEPPKVAAPVNPKDPAAVVAADQELRKSLEAMGAPLDLTALVRKTTGPRSA